MPGRIMVAITSPDGQIRQLNHHCELAIGAALSDVVGQMVWDLLPVPADAESMRLGVLAVANGEDIDDQLGSWKTIVAPPPDRSRRRSDPGSTWTANEWSVFPVTWGYSAMRDTDGKVQGVIVSGNDMRALSRLQEEIAETADRYQAILDTAVDGILTINETGRVQSFNRAAERIFGYRAAEVIGCNVSVLMPQPYRSEHDGYLSNYLTTRRKKIIGIGREVEGLRKDGTTFPLELSVGEVVVSGKRMFTGIIRDISDRKQIEGEARRRQDELAHLTRVHSMGDLAAGLAHEINQPLTAILGHSKAWIRMLDTGPPDVELLRDSIQQIARQGERAAEVIRRLRKYVEKGEIEREPSNLGAIVQEALELLQHELKSHSVRVDMNVDSPLPEILIDRVQIEQVMVNLVRNATQAMVGSQIAVPRLNLTISNSAESSGIRVSVGDNGPGFGETPPEELFAPFFTTKKEGLGQGLSICRRIIDAHGGKIWAEANPGGGALFNVWLPLDGREGRRASRGVT